jgi:HEAT repeat protein
VDGLARRPEENLETLMASAQIDSHFDVVRSAAIRSLAKSKSPKAMHALIALTGPENNREVRIQAASFLGKSWKTDTTVKSTLEKMKTEEDPRIKETATKALEK